MRDADRACAKRTTVSSDTRRAGKATTCRASRRDACACARRSARSPAEPSRSGCAVFCRCRLGRGSLRQSGSARSAPGAGKNPRRRRSSATRSVSRRGSAARDAHCARAQPGRIQSVAEENLRGARDRATIALVALAALVLAALLWLLRDVNRRILTPAPPRRKRWGTSSRTARPRAARNVFG